MNGSSRDTTGLEAGQRVLYRRAGKTTLYAGVIEAIDSQKPFPVQVMLDNGTPVVALCNEVVPIPPDPEWVEAFLDGPPSNTLR